MTRISYEDFQKLIKLLAKEGQDGGILGFHEAQSHLEIIAVDRSNKEMKISLSDVQYPFKPTITKTESF